MFLSLRRGAAGRAALFIVMLTVVGCALVERAEARGQDQGQQQPEQTKKEPTPQEKAYAKLQALSKAAAQANTDFLLSGCGDKQKMTNEDREKIAKLKHKADMTNFELDYAIDKYI